ncbi:DUF3883 domain-containing protein [Bacillus sp. WMMC1349]|uniref:DUF3883 domain-containing protein n=1 Tax=Bacillus sp. WMMC1349 TaxID=2736254 RepID=UPI001552AC78|nr:DUF3883 domain-containing protein [Bacillus sp. WMMC1349]NPC91928.1 DUF3883 domain-containing protein [Bacillus sp. WMMC1349]
MVELTNRRKALIVAYYLSKYDKKALRSLQYETFRAAFHDIGTKLGIKPNTIKNRRDDYDSIHDNGRNGWYQKELSKRSLEIVQTFEGVSEDALKEIVEDILNGNAENEDILDIFKEDSEGDLSVTYNHRGVTGKKAEQIFMDYFNDGFLSDFKGDLIDTRDEGCGYDFKLARDANIVFEVKGLSDATGGISFTDKEWKVAKQLRKNYNLIIVSEVFVSPKVRLVVDPYEKINPRKNITKVVSVNWIFQSKDLEQ